ncbi:MAG: hypothetical protein ACK4FF_08395 [Limnobacter sp.]|uniref:hypothetical protein n=1 Tax=Limnobacter sp. TaxID=2003368 RepID=UPI00391B55D8
MNNPLLWRVLQAGLVLIWLAVPFGDALGMPKLTTLGLVLLVLHALEIPLSKAKVASTGVGTGRMVVMTLLFGFTWWLPVSKRVIAP